jgi:hemoglobin-like flavoprotein
MTASTNLIQHSFELAAASCEDLTPLVYRRLFREHPEASLMFRSEDAYGTPRELFGEFFGAIADSLSEILGSDWSPEMDKAWRKLLAEIDTVIAQSEA